jgi:sugar/nucleoside kinase (ribokinase family)
MSSPDLLSIGHVARDEFADGTWRLGGSALYAAVAAARLGRRVALVTRVADRERAALEELCGAEGVALHRLPASVTTTFAHTFDAEGRRSLRLRARAKSIGALDVPEALRGIGAVFLGSVIGEHGDDVFSLGPGVLAAQGEMRAFDAHGAVRPTDWRRAASVLPRLRAAVLSDEDLARDLSRAKEWSRHAPVVVTLGPEGAVLYRDGAELASRAFRIPAVVDQTGAGDTFALGLLVALDEGRDWPEALAVGNAVASFCLEGEATRALADRAGVERRIATGERI